MRVNIDDIVRDQAEYVMYDGKEYTGEVVETLDDGTVITLNTYRIGREEGPQFEYYTDGSPRSEYWIVNGRLTGESREWHENGQLALRQRYDEFGNVSQRETWDENGQPEAG